MPFESQQGLQFILRKISSERYQNQLRPLDATNLKKNPKNHFATHVQSTKILQTALNQLREVLFDSIHTPAVIPMTHIFVNCILT